MKIKSFLRMLAGALSALSVEANSTAPADPTGFAHVAAVRRVEFDPSGKWLISTDENTIRVWSMPDGTPSGTVVLPTGAKSFRCSPTEPLIAVLTQKYDVELRRIPDLELIRAWPSLDLTVGIAFGPKGDILATCATSGGIRFWDTATGAQVKRIELNEGFVDLAFSPDGKWLVSAGTTGRWDGRPKLNVWQLSNYTRVQEAITPYSQGTFFTTVFTPDSAYVAAGSNNDQLSLWHIPSGKKAVIKEGWPYALWAVSAGVDGRTLFSADRGLVRVWTLPECAVRTTFEAHQKQINSIAVAPDGLTIATGSDDRTIRIWALADHALVRNLVAPKPAPSTPPAQTVVATTTDAKKPSDRSAPGLVVSGRLVSPDGQPITGINLKLPLAFPSEKGGLLYMFSPNFFEATTDADGRFKFNGIKTGEKYALVHLGSGRPSPLKRTDGSIVLLDFAEGARNVDLGDIPFERR